MTRLPEARYRFWRWLAPKMPSRAMRDWCWARKWQLWHDLHGPHQSLWMQAQ